MDLPVTSIAFRSRLGNIALSHHLPHEHDRCVVIGTRHVCRRCLILYPVAFTVMFLALGSIGWPESLDPVLLLMLPAPVAIEYIAEQLGGLRYDARRQVLLTMVAAPALGTGLARHIVSPFGTWFMVMIGVHGGACGVAHLLASYRRERDEQQTRNSEAEADPVLDGFDSAEEFRSYLDARTAS